MRPRRFASAEVRIISIKKNNLRSSIVVDKAAVSDEGNERADRFSASQQ